MVKFKEITNPESKVLYAKNLNNTAPCDTVLVPGYPSQV